jgi:hypothetical protein
MRVQTDYVRKEEVMTDQQRFIELIKTFSAYVGLDAEWVLRGNAVDVDGIAFNVLYKPDMAKTYYVFADFGRAPLGKEGAVYQNLLEANLGLYCGNGPAFSLSAKTSHVLYGECQSLANATPETLAECLAQLATRIKKWRVDHTIESVDPSSNRKKTSIAAQLFREMQSSPK